MPDAASNRSPRPRGYALVMIIGGGCWLAAISDRLLYLALAICGAGLLWHSRRTDRARPWRTRLGTGLLWCGLLCAMIAWIGFSHAAVVATRLRVTPTGQVIDTVGYTVGWLCQHYVGPTGLLLLNLGVLLRASAATTILHQRLMYLLGLTGIALYLCLAWDRYLDAILPPDLLIVLRAAFGLGWWCLGYKGRA